MTIGQGVVINESFDLNSDVFVDSRMEVANLTELGQMGIDHKRKGLDTDDTTIIDVDKMYTILVPLGFKSYVAAEKAYYVYKEVEGKINDTNYTYYDWILEADPSALKDQIDKLWGIHFPWRPVASVVIGDGTDDKSLNVNYNKNNITEVTTLSVKGSFLKNTPFASATDKIVVTLDDTVITDAADIISVKMGGVEGIKAALAYTFDIPTDADGRTTLNYEVIITSDINGEYKFPINISFTEPIFYGTQDVYNADITPAEIAAMTQSSSNTINFPVNTGAGKVTCYIAVPGSMGVSMITDAKGDDYTKSFNVVSGLDVIIPGDAAATATDKYNVYIQIVQTKLDAGFTYVIK